MLVYSQQSLQSTGVKQTLKPWAGQPSSGKWNLLQCQINIFCINCIGARTIIYADRRQLAGQKGALQRVLCRQGPAGPAGSLCEPLPRQSPRSGTILAALGSSPLSGNMRGEMGRGAQPWLGAEEQRVCTASGVRDHLQLGQDLLLCWAAWLLLATSSCRILLLSLLSASQPCSLQTLLFFLFSSLWSWPNYPPAQGLRHLLPSRNVCSSCSSVPFSPVK